VPTGVPDKLITSAEASVSETCEVSTLFESNSVENSFSVISASAKKRRHQVMATTTMQEGF
jgi:hypothetical protein